MMRWRRAVAHRRRGQPCSCEARPAILRMSTRSMPTKGNNQFFRACSGVLDALLSFHCETNLSADTLIVFPSDQRPYGATASKPRAILIVPPNRAQNLSASSCGRSLLWTCVDKTCASTHRSIPNPTLSGFPSPCKNQSANATKNAGSSP
jgi:hypothetical protein